jgi:GDPmannose 4,6-dehydratase
MLQQEEPEDFVIASGNQFCIRDFIVWSAEELGLKLRFEGTGLEEIAIIESIIGDHIPSLKVGDIIVRVDQRYFRPAEVDSLLGDPSKAKRKLGWIPKISAREMCKEMILSDLLLAKKSSSLNIDIKK